MSRLFLACALCGRKQAEGLLSRADWAQVEGPEGRTVRVCPTCKQVHSDWEERGVAAASRQAAATIDLSRLTRRRFS